jgi:hypothetical protein
MADQADLVARLEKLQSLMANMNERLDRVESKLSAVVRMTMIREPAADVLGDLDRRRFAYSSQHEEDGMLYALFSYTGTPTRWFVEIGCGSNGGNSGFLARECGWSGLMVDAVERAVRKAANRYDRHRVRFDTLRVSSKNVAALLAKHGTPEEPDLVSVDIDSTDYWVVRALTANYRPRVLVVEYNSVYGPTEAVTVPDVEVFVRSPKGAHHQYYGASLNAFVRLGQKRGYRLITTDSTGTNAVFLRNDVGPEIAAADPAKAFRYYFGHQQVVDEIGDAAMVFRTSGLTLVEV